MARLLNNEAPKEPTFVFEFTQSEVDAVNSVIADVADPARKVVIDYTFDQSRVVATDICREKLAAVAKVLEDADPNPNISHGYDYFDWFKEEK